MTEPSQSELAGLRRADGSPLRVGGLLGSGGEGWVYQVDDGAQHAIALKLYQPAVLKARGSDLAVKLQAMVDKPPDNPTAEFGHPSLAWPKEIVVDRQGRFAGFTMPQLDKESTLAMHQVVNPSDRHNTGLPSWITAHEDWGRLIRTAANLAAATQSLHEAGYVIGDFNESNLLVTDRALVTMIDCDSMQVPAGNGGYFLGAVGKPEFTAPEVGDFKTQPRSRHADDFALAVHCFMLLMRGRHPFSGIWHGPGDDKPVQLVLARRGLYCIAGDVILEPPRGTPPPNVLPPSVLALFARAFGVPADPAGRPTAAEWKVALDDLEESLVPCSRDPRHRYGSHLSSCPWCQMDAARSASAGSTQPTGQRPYQPPSPHQAAASYQATGPHQTTGAGQATGTPYSGQAFQPPASPRYPNTTYQFKPASSSWTRLWYRYRRPFAILSAIVLLILVTVYSLQNSSSPGTPVTATQPGAIGDPQRGTLTIRPDQDYLLAVGMPYPAAYDEGDLAGTPDGVKLYGAIGLPLPRGIAGSYQSCVALDWTSTQRWNFGYVIPWKQLTPGRQFCVDTVYSGLWVSLLTVESAPVGEEVTFSVATWACTAAREAAIC